MNELTHHSPEATPSPHSSAGHPARLSTLTNGHRPPVEHRKRYSRTHTRRREQAMPPRHGTPRAKKDNATYLPFRGNAQVSERLIRLHGINPVLAMISAAW